MRHTMTDTNTNEKYRKLRGLGFKTFEEMDLELKNGLRKSITQEDVEKSTELKRALYPDWIIYPKGDEIYEAIEVVEIDYMTAWSAPFAGGGKTTFPKGEQISIVKPNHDKPTSMYCDPVNYDELHSIIVPEKDRRAKGYNGYYLCIDTLNLNTKFKLVSSEQLPKSKKTFFERLKKIFI